jgi:hypothetical protein
MHGGGDGGELEAHIVVTGGKAVGNINLVSSRSTSRYTKER